MREPRAAHVVAVVAAAGAALVGPAINAGAQTTALYIEVRTTNPDATQTSTYTTNDLVFIPLKDASQASAGVYAAKFNVPSTAWSIRFSNERGQVLGPGTYEAGGVYDGGWWAGPSLYILKSSQSIPVCSVAFARFRVYEVAFDSSGATTRFAADFEQHCVGTGASYFGALRYNASRTSLVPFDGAYPDYSLHIDPAPNGIVTGGGIDCGGGHTTCDTTYLSPTAVTLTAQPAAGYVFVGWSGRACRVHSAPSLTVISRTYCRAVFAASPGSGADSPDYSAGAYVVDRPDVAIDNSLTRATFAYLNFPSQPETSTILPFGTPNRLTFNILGSGGTLGSSPTSPTGEWVTFGAPPGQPLAVGEYRYTNDVSNPLDRPVLSVCSNGRFVVYEVEFSGGILTKFAADYEGMCPDGRITGSLRYHSTRTGLLPFDGAYPLYALGIASTLGGYVSGNGIDCGDGGRTSCEKTYATPTTETLTANASPGYAFAGWTGNCVDILPSTSVVVDRLQRCVAVFAPAPGSSAPIDPQLPVKTIVLQFPGATDGLAGAVVATTIPNMMPPPGWPPFPSIGDGSTRLQPGDYDQVYWNSNGAYPRFQFAMPSLPGGFGQSGPCGAERARMRIYEIAYDATNRITSIAVDFEALCPFSTRPRVVGAYRLNSTRTSLTPFDGDFPAYAMAIDRSANGIVTSTGLDCGASHMTCRAQFGTPTILQLKATPLPGYRFAGWSGACDGGSITSVLVDLTLHCEPLFTASIPGLVPDDPRLGAGAFFIDSAAGDPVGGGRRHLWVDVVVEAGIGPRIAGVSVRLPDGYYWQMYFRPPAGVTLAPGVYENAVDVLAPEGPPGLTVLPPQSVFCTPVMRRFVIHEITFSSTGALASIAADFQQSCAGAPPLLGSVRYHSQRAQMKPFAPTVFVPAAAVGRDFNGDGRADIVWRNTATGQNAIWLMNNTTAAATVMMSPLDAASTSLVWNIRAAADLNHDGFADVIWQNDANGQIAVWYFAGTNRIGTQYLVDAAGNNAEPDPDWKIIAAGDLDRDGNVDLLWRNQSTGALRVWHMNGTADVDEVFIPAPTNTDWEVVGLADLNGDGWLDLVWRNSADGSLACWFLNDTLLRGTVWLSPQSVGDLNWRVVGVVDMNGDGHPDLVWQHLVSGQLAVWFLNGTQAVGYGYLTPSSVSPTTWRIVAVR